MFGVPFLPVAGWCWWMEWDLFLLPWSDEEWFCGLGRNRIVSGFIPQCFGEYKLSTILYSICICYLFLSSFFMFAVLLVNVPMLFVHMTFLTHTNKYCIHTLIYNKIHVYVLLWWVTVSVITSQGLWVNCVTSLTATTAINRKADRPSATTAMKFIQQVFIFSKSLLDNNLCVGLCQRINMFVCMLVYVV